MCTKSGSHLKIFKISYRRLKWALKYSGALDIMAIVVRERHDVSQSRIYIMLLKGWKGRQNFFCKERKTPRDLPPVGCWYSKGPNAKKFKSLQFL